MGNMQQECWVSTPGVWLSGKQLGIWSRMREKQSDLYPGYKGRVLRSQNPGYGGGSVESLPVVGVSWGSWGHGYHIVSLFSCYFHV